MRSVGRLFQIAALVVLPLSIVLQLNNQVNVKQMLLLLVAGVCLFFIGRIVEGYAAG